MCAAWRQVGLVAVKALSATRAVAVVVGLSCIEGSIVSGGGKSALERNLRSRAFDAWSHRIARDLAGVCLIPTIGAQGACFHIRCQGVAAGIARVAFRRACRRAGVGDGASGACSALIGGATSADFICAGFANGVVHRLARYAGIKRQSSQTRSDLRDVVGAGVAGTVEVDAIVTAVTVADAPNNFLRGAAILVADVVSMATGAICLV